MKTLFVAVVAVVAALMVVPPTTYADNYYVIRNPEGDMGVTNGLPLYDWFVQSGPYPSIDSAERATGVGTGGPNFLEYYNSRLGSGASYDFQYPQAIARRPGQIPIVKAMP